MSKSGPRTFLMAVHGAITIGKPLPLRASAFETKVIPMAELLPDTCEIPLRQYSVKLLATISGVSASTIKREIKDEILIALKQRGRTVIFHKDAMAYLASLPRVGS